MSISKPKGRVPETSGNIEKVYEDGTVQIYKARDPEGARQLSRHTRWGLDIDSGGQPVEDSQTAPFLPFMVFAINGKKFAATSPGNGYRLFDRMGRVIPPNAIPEVVQRVINETGFPPSLVRNPSEPLQ